MRRLPGGMNKNYAHTKYKSEWNSIINEIFDSNVHSTRPQSALTYPAFVKVWNKHMPTLKVSSGGTDYCDYCVTIEKP